MREEVFIFHIFKCVLCALLGSCGKCDLLASTLEPAAYFRLERFKHPAHKLQLHHDDLRVGGPDGTELDVAREGRNEGFKFNNPNVKAECGCGESFNV